jgi:hypothetical protein
MDTAVSARRTELESRYPDFVLCPDRALDTPAVRAALFRLMCEEFADKTKAAPDTDVIPFEPHPHTNFFHPESGAWVTVTNRGAKAYTAKTPLSRKGTLAACLYRRCEVADMKDDKGDTMKPLWDPSR